jgi:fructose-specific phosphotransferase system IIC component
MLKEIILPILGIIIIGIVIYFILKETRKTQN